MPSASTVLVVQKCAKKMLSASPTKAKAGEEVEVSTRTLCNGRFEVLQRLDGGAFGDVYIGFDRELKRNVAVKIESSRGTMPRLVFEAKVYMAFEKDPAPGFPRMYYHGVEGEFNILVSDLLGPNLELLFKYCSYKFTLKTVLMIAVQLIYRSEALHARRFVHRDLKPENICMGTKQRGHHLFLIDYGLARYYTNGHVHASYRDGLGMTGTARYCSLWTHLGIEQSRRDDLESCAFILLYFLKGGVPWQGITAVDERTKLLRVAERKEFSPTTLFKGCHPCFREYLSAVRSLKYDGTPDYNALRQLFFEAMVEERIVHDYRFDWMVNFEQTQEKRRLRSIHPSTSKSVDSAALSQSQVTTNDEFS